MKNFCINSRPERVKITLFRNNLEFKGRHFLICRRCYALVISSWSYVKVMLKSYWPDQERNDWKPWNIHAIPYFYSEIQHNWQIISYISLILPPKFGYSENFSAPLHMYIFLADVHYCELRIWILKRTNFVKINQDIMFSVFYYMFLFSQILKNGFNSLS